MTVIDTADMAELDGLIEGWAHDPVAFAVEALDFRPWKKQRDVLWDLYEHGLVSVRSGHGVGKSAIEAVATWWQLVCFDDSVVLATAPTSHQLYDVLWAEIARWKRNLPPWIANRFAGNQERIYCKEAKDTWFAVARTARPERPEALAGFHVNRKHRLLILGDEASGIHNAHFETLEGALTTDGVRALICGNPTRPDGYFFDTHKIYRDIWRCHKVSCLDAPARIVSPAYAERVARRYGTDSNVYRVRVEGEFPTSSDDSVIPLEWAEAALLQAIPANWFYDCPQQMTLRIDVARFGSDDSVLTAVQGQYVMGAWAWHGNDTVESAANVFAVAKLIHALTEEWKNDRLYRPGYWPVILVDDVGVGAGVADHLRHIVDIHGNLVGDTDAERLLTVIGVPSGGRPNDTSMFDKVRDELWWRSRLFFQDGEPGIAPPPSREVDASLMGWSPLRPRIDREVRERLVAELSVPKYRLLPNGKIHVESKDEVKKRIGGDEAKSPDVADSLNLGFYRTNYAKAEPIVGDSWERQIAEMGGNKFWRA